MDKLDQIFDAFSQADSTISRSHGGTGLGLAISKRLVELMGGQLMVQSTYGHGSEFSFVITLRLDRAGRTRGQLTTKRDTARDDEPERLEGLHVLLVDDSELNREVATFMLHQAGARVTQAANGQEAITMLRQAGQSIDIVLMDVQMPVMDGHAATRIIRSIPDFSDLPILALTAGAMASQRRKALQSGMSGFISKPFEAGALVAMVAQHARAGRHLLSAPPEHDPGLADMLEKLKARFIHDKLPAHLHLLRSATGPEACSTEAAVATLHKMAGEAGTVGLLPLSEQARHLEQRIEETGSLTMHRKALDCLLQAGQSLAEGHR